MRHTVPDRMPRPPINGNPCREIPMMPSAGVPYTYVSPTPELPQLRWIKPVKDHQTPQSDGGKHVSYTVRSSQKETTFFKDGKIAVPKDAVLWLTYVEGYGPAFSHRSKTPPPETELENLSEVDEALEDNGFGLDYPWYNCHDPADITIFEISNVSERWYAKVDLDDPG